MDILKKLNIIGSLESAPFKKLNELEQNHEYPVTEIKQISTKNGNKIVVLLIDSEWNDFLVFLPDRFNKNITDKEIKYLNKLPKLKFVYRGTKECGKGNPAHITEFIE